MIALYMDENVEWQIIGALRQRNIDVLTTEQDNRNHTPDPEVLDRAIMLGRVVFSRDQDFLREATRRQQGGDHFAGVIYAHKLYVSLGKCVEDLEYLATAGSPEDFADQVYFLPL